MPELTPQQSLLIGIFIAPAIFTLCAFYTRANPRRTAGGLLGAIAYSLVQYAWDRAAANFGWWRYPAYGTTSSLPMPIAIYILSGLVFGGFGLIGWRVARRFRWKGILAFLAVWSIWGFTLDTVGSSAFSASRLMVIDAGATARIADFLVYFTCMAAVLLVIRLISGSFRGDPLARTPKSTAFL